MHILVGVGAALLALYWWLLGHWFARIVVFLCLAPIGQLMAGGINQDRTIGVVWAIASWFIASIPLYVARWRERRSVRSLPRGAGPLVVQQVRWPLLK